MKKLLILEDEKELNQLLTLYFSQAGYEILSAKSCREAEILLLDEPDLIIADVSLPDGSGLTFARNRVKIMKKAIPILFLTASDSDEDILCGYEAGCEEYVTKPVSPLVLLKKVQAILKRASAAFSVLAYQDLVIQPEKRKVYVEEREVKLALKEWEILEILFSNPNQIVTIQTLLEKVWYPAGREVDENTVRVAVNRLRKKIEPNPRAPIYIKSVFGVGYTFGE